MGNNLEQIGQSESQGDWFAEIRETLVRNATNFRQSEQEVSSSKLLEQPKTTFSVLHAPSVPQARAIKSYSTLSALKQSGTPARVIEEKFRKKDVCAAYVTGLLKQEYGDEAVTKAGLQRFDKIADAWNVKATGLLSGGLEVAASATDTLEKTRYGRMRIKDKRAYTAGVENFFKSADAGNYPSILTAFQTNTRHAREINDENKNKPPELQSYNSHVLVMLGREPVKSEVLGWGLNLSAFLNWKAGVKSDYQKFLNVKVVRKDGTTIEINADGKADIRNADGTSKSVDMRTIWLKRGDTISWQDVLVTDFYKGKERVMGLGAYASKWTTILMENLKLKHVEKKEEKSPYRVLGFVQIEKNNVPIYEQLKMKIGLTDDDFRYYLAALAEIGVDTNRLSEKDIIPKLDIAEIRLKIDEKGGPAKLQTEILAANVKDYNAAHPGNI